MRLTSARSPSKPPTKRKSKTHGKKFDTGLMALVCRHGIVLFLANVDTPGEQQKFGIALIEHFMTLVPVEATVAVFYDIRCVVDRSLKLVSARSKISRVFSRSQTQSFPFCSK
ncbi:hypothetical protein OH76DRAFT_539080 [Lentinus brumalis]|uniref:Uncharacterized protein n=1 Tax=Lentinus brumalis TaxID=2498619 RepID=A0A371CHJ2_9APHY|nr:hypothetical protein OH76DRAFT_539080 [Polyporus brumalis]